MSDETTAGPRARIKQALAHRLRSLREELFGEHGGPQMAKLLDLPARTWYGCETGEDIPGEILVLVAERTRARYEWLLTGHGPSLRAESD